MENIFLSINHNVNEFLTSFIIENNLEKIISILADWPIFFLPIFLVFTWLYFTFKQKNIEKKIDLLNIFYWILLVVIINYIIQSIFFLERPENIVNPILNSIPNPSFPSDHAAISVAFLTWLFLAGYKKIWYIFLIFVLLMNFSRIAGWIHRFFDIIAGLIIWILSALFIFKYKKSKVLEKVNNFILKKIWYFKL